MSRASLRLCCITVLAFACGEDRGTTAGGGSTESSTEPGTTSATDTSTDTSTESTTETETETDTGTETGTETGTDTDTETDTDTDTPPVCGDGLIEADELCDAGELGGETCMSQGFDSGVLTCAPDCMGFDTSACGLCGNELVDGDEVCDGTDLGAETCMTQGFDSGVLGCAIDCTSFEPAGCGSCGNDIIDGDEACDGQDLGGQSCAAMDLVGDLGCTPGCTIDASTCSEPQILRLLLTQGAEIQERELDGMLVNATAVPLNGGAEAELRELAHFDGVTYVYRGTFTPTMTHYDANTMMWVHASHPGWSTVNNVSYGGLAYAQDWIWVTDMITAGAAETGLVRFSLSGMPSERVYDNAQYVDVFAGHDGLLYAVRSNGTTLDRYDPATAQPAGQLTLAAGVRAIAVAQDGSMVGASWGGSVFLFDDTGALLDSLAGNIEGLVDVDLASDGTIAIGGSLGNVLVIEPGLGNILHSWDAGADESFVEFLEGP